MTDMLSKSGRIQNAHVNPGKCKKQLTVKQSLMSDSQKAGMCFSAFLHGHEKGIQPHFSILIAVYRADSQ